MNLQRIAILSAFAAVGLYVIRQQQETNTDDTGEAQDTALDFTDQLIMKTATITGTWRPGEPYASWIVSAEDNFAIPRDLLARVLYEESRYRPDIINGEVRSPAGAVGIAQFMPATAAWLKVDPLDPQQAIWGAAHYLSNLYRQFGNWGDALAAYNWGPGNLSKKGFSNAPRETVAYVSHILGDVPA
jgi:soluble lytic murein transglycosylase-like protein